jgi:hypothetical protein
MTIAKNAAALGVIDIIAPFSFNGFVSAVGNSAWASMVVWR